VAHRNGFSVPKDRRNEDYVTAPGFRAGASPGNTYQLFLNVLTFIIRHEVSQPQAASLIS